MTFPPLGYGITNTYSYGLVIRDTLYAKLVSLPFFTGWKSRRCKQLPSHPAILPYLGVYIVSERMSADGDYNAGEVRFDSELTVGFSAVIQNNDPVESELKLDETFWTIMNGLWRDPWIMHLGGPRPPPSVVALPYGIQIEGVKGGNRRHIWGASGLDNETPIAELSYTADVCFSQSFPPIITDDLLRIHQETVPMTAAGIPPVDAVIRIITEYEFTPAPTPKAA